MCNFVADFKNHIFSIPESQTIIIDAKRAESYYTKSKFNKKTLLNPMAMCIILMGYVLLEKFFKLPFWTYFLVVSLLIGAAVSWAAMVIKYRFDTRYKK